MQPKSGLMSFLPDSVNKGSVGLADDYTVIKGTGVPGGALIDFNLKGKQVFKFQIVKSKAFDIHIGARYFGKDAKLKHKPKAGWSLHLKSGKKYELKTALKYSKIKLTVGEIVTMTVDQKRGSLSFKVGDNDLGEAF